MLISFFESTKITTSCWTTVNRRTLNLLKRDTPCPKTRYDKTVGGAQSRLNQIPYPPDGWPTDWRTIIPKKFPTVLKVQNPRSGFPAWGPNKGTGNLHRSDLKGQWGLITRLPWNWGKQTSVLEGTNRTLQTQRLRGKERWLHRKLNQNCLLVLEGLLWRWVGLAGAYHRDRGTSSSCFGRSLLE